MKIIYFGNNQRGYHCLEAILKKESFEVADQDLEEEIKRLVPQAKTPEEIQDHMKKINLDGLRQMLLQRKTVDFIVENAKIVDK